MAGFADRIGDLSWLGEAYNDQGWVIVGDAPVVEAIGPIENEDPKYEYLDQRVRILETRGDPNLAELLATVQDIQKRVLKLEEPYLLPPSQEPTPLELARARQKELLEASDWAVLPDVPMIAGQRDAWVAYRRAVREIHLQEGFPTNINWPVAPQ